MEGVGAIIGEAGVVTLTRKGGVVTLVVGRTVSSFLPVQV